MGTPLEGVERKRLKLGNLKMTKEAWAALTDLGRAEPAKAFEITVSRAVTSLSRDREQWNLLNNPTVDLVQFWCSDPCRSMQAFMAQTETLPKTQMPRFPLNHCTKAVCQCKVHRHYRSDFLFDIPIPEDGSTADQNANPLPPKRTWVSILLRAVFGLITIYAVLAIYMNLQ
jgi:glutamate/tyrosine decarboxylase-like PLP-dependent enzyme